MARSTTRSAFTAFRAFMALALLGCQTTPTPTPTSEQPPLDVVSKLAEASNCRLALPTPRDPPRSGPVYVLINRVGLLRISEDAVSVAIPPGPEANPYEWGFRTQMLVAPDGELWLADYTGIRVLSETGEVRQIPTIRDRTYARLVVRSASDVWAVSSDIEWSVDHFDGARWQQLRTRSDFPGRYDDNKFVELAVTDEGVWVASWNGVWQGVGASWQAVTEPNTFPLGLWTYRDDVVLEHEHGLVIHDGRDWIPFAWQSVGGRIDRAIDDLGVVVDPGLDMVIRLYPIDGDACTVTSQPLAGGYIEAFALDESGRTWVVTDRTLAVLDTDGHVAAQWPPGSLPGLSGQIEAIAVVGAGPSRLLPTGKVRTRAIVGRVVLMDRRPLAGARVELCAGVGERCPKASLIGATVSAANGSFRLEHVPEGEFHLNVLPPDIEACRGVFSANEGRLVATAQDCVGPNEEVCDVGDLIQCQPFELPPPP